MFHLISDLVFSGGMSYGFWNLRSAYFPRGIYNPEWGWNQVNNRTLDLEQWVTDNYPEDPLVIEPHKGRKYWKVQKDGRLYRLYEDGTTVLTSMFTPKGNQIAEVAKGFSDVLRAADSDGYTGPYRYPNQ